MYNLLHFKYSIIKSWVGIMDFIEKNGISYGSENEYNYRLDIFTQNLERIELLSLNNPLATFAINEFADKTKEEMKMRKGLRTSVNAILNDDHNSEITAQSFDWSGMWKIVRNQGEWGSCWSFSATASFESKFALHKGDKYITKEFTMQQLVDLDTEPEGWNGGSI